MIYNKLTQPICKFVQVRIMGILTDKELNNKAEAITRAIAQKVADERKRQKVSAYHLAKSVGVTENTIKNIEAGQNTTLKTVFKVLAGLGINPTIIL